MSLVSLCIFIFFFCFPPPMIPITIIMFLEKEWDIALLSMTIIICSFSIAGVDLYLNWDFQ